MSVTIQNGGNSIRISTQGPAGPQGAQGEQGIQGIQGEPGPAGSNEWGAITGLLENQTDLNTVLGELETASDTNESNLNTHIADTDIHFSDAPSDGSQYARQDGGWSVVAGGGGASAGDDTDITGLLHGDGSTLSAATAAQVRAAADLDTTDSPTFDSLTLTNDISLSDGATIEIGSGTGEATISGDLDISGGSSTLKTGYGQAGLKAFSGLSGTITPDGGVALAFVNYFGNTGAYFATDNSGKFKIYSASLNSEAGFSGNQWGASGFRATSSGSKFFPAFQLDATSGDEGGFYLSGTDQVWCSDRTDRVKLKRTGELEVLFDLDVSGDITASGNIDFSGLPTSDPVVAGRLWNDSGTLKVSAG